MVVAPRGAGGNWILASRAVFPRPPSAFGREAQETAHLELRGARWCPLRGVNYLCRQILRNNWCRNERESEGRGLCVESLLQSIAVARLVLQEDRLVSVL